MTARPASGVRGGARFGAPRTTPPLRSAARWASSARCRVRPRRGLPRERERRPAPWRRPQSGSATVELAAVIPLLVVVTIAMVGLVVIARDQVLAQGAAREGAREAALGGDRARAVSAARAALPAGRAARVTVAPAGAGRVRVDVELPAGLPFGAPSVTVRAAAVASVEPGPPPPPSGP
jgi:TadE-like protein